MPTPKKAPAAKKTTGRVTPKKFKEQLSAADVSDFSEWKKDNEPVPVRVPSGNVALLRQVDIRKFMSEGIMPNSLLPIVQEAMDAKTAPKQKKIEQLAANPETIREMMDFLDKVALLCVVKPDLTPAPPEGEERDSSVLYVDDVDVEDKVFIFQWAVGGTSDLESFR